MNETGIFFQDITKDQLDKSIFHEISVEYDPVNLNFKSLKNSFISNKEHENRDSFSSFLIAKEGAITLIWKAGLQLKLDGILKMNGFVLTEIMEKIYSLKYYEESGI